jgi:hypothetical protein
MRVSPEAQISIPYRHSGLVLPLAAGNDIAPRHVELSLQIQIEAPSTDHERAGVGTSASDHPDRRVTAKQESQDRERAEHEARKRVRHADHPGDGKQNTAGKHGIDRDGSLLLDLTSPVSHFALSAALRKHARSQTLVISSRFFDLSRESLGDLISSHIAR